MASLGHPHSCASPPGDDPPATAAVGTVWLTAQRSAAAQRRDRFVAGSGAHPARMLAAIAAHAIATYSRPGDLVLDPMCGIGTTLVEGVLAGRDAFGVDLQPDSVALSHANIALARRHGATGHGRARCGDATRLTTLVPPPMRGNVALVLTSPPYGPTMHGRVEHRRGPLTKFANSYGPPNPASLTRRGLVGLTDGPTAILAGCHQVLKPGGIVVVTARPRRRDGLLVDLPGAVITAGSAAGLLPIQRCVALLAAVRDGRLIPGHSFFQLDTIRKARHRGIPLHLIAHEDVLVFQRPASSGCSPEPRCPRVEPPCHSSAGACGTPAGRP